MSLWVIITIGAAAVQTVRFMLQKQLRSAGLSTGGATFSRFLFAAPLAFALALCLTFVPGNTLPDFGARFWAYALMGGFMQIVATLATVALFAERNFAVGIAFTKSETVLVAAFSALFLGEAVSPGGLGAIAVGVCGVLLLSVPADRAGRFALWNRASRLGLLAGACFGLSAIGYRGAALALGDGNFFFRASVTLAAVTASQCLGMAVWLRLREPGTLAQVARSWRKTALVGITGMLGSLGWFTAFTLQNAAYVRAVGQVELVFSVLVTWLVFREKASRREIAGICLLGLSIVAIILLT